MSYTTTYKQVLKWRKGALRRTLRYITLRTLSLNAHVNKDFKGIQFLYFHYIYDDEIENAKKIIKWVSENFKVISYSEAVERMLNNTIDDYYICFSSDDGLKSNLAAAEIFNKYNISCCFFINPATIENRDLKYQEKICTERLGVPLTDFLTWNDVENLVEQGHEIGNHTYDHRISVNLKTEAFEEDLQKSTQILEKKTGSVKHFAFPRGLFQYFNYSLKQITHNHGYETCATAERGCHIPLPNKVNTKEMSIRRDVIVFKEPLSFVKYFMNKSQKTSKESNSYWENN